jgi:hypothetical protein
MKNIVVGGNPATILNGDLQNTIQKSYLSSSFSLYVTYGPNQGRHNEFQHFKFPSRHIPSKRGSLLQQTRGTTEDNASPDTVVTHTTSAPEVEDRTNATRRYLHG